MKIDLIPLIIKKKKQIFLFVFSWVVIGFLYSIFATPLYNSYISIYPSENDHQRFDALQQRQIFKVI